MILPFLKMKVYILTHFFFIIYVSRGTSRLVAESYGSERTLEDTLTHCWIWSFYAIFYYLKKICTTQSLIFKHQT